MLRRVGRGGGGRRGGALGSGWGWGFGCRRTGSFVLMMMAFLVVGFVDFVVLVLVTVLLLGAL